MSTLVLSLIKQMYIPYVCKLLLCNYQSNQKTIMINLTNILVILDKCPFKLIVCCPHAGPVFESLAFFSVTLKWRDFVYPGLCLLNIWLSGGVSQSSSSTQSLQTASKHSALSNRTILNFPLFCCAERKYGREEHNHGL